jgi:hypothetical protein
LAAVAFASNTYLQATVKIEFHNWNMKTITGLFLSPGPSAKGYRCCCREEGGGDACEGQGGVRTDRSGSS